MSKSLLSEISLQENEKLLWEDEFQADRYTEPFAFAVTDRAIFVTRTKNFVKNPYYLERIPLSQVKQVFLEKERPLKMWILSGIIFIFGLIFTILMMTPVLSGQEGYVSGVPIAMIVCGIILPFLARSRKTLSIQLNNEIYKWKPKLVVDKNSKNRISKMQDLILENCKRVGITVLKIV